MALRETMVRHKAATPIPPGPRFIKLPEVALKLGKGADTLKAMIEAGEFPPPIALHRRADSWLASEIDEWILNKHQKARNITQ